MRSRRAWQIAAQASVPPLRRSVGPTSIGSQLAAMSSCRRARSRFVAAAAGVELVGVVLDRDPRVRVRGVDSADERAPPPDLVLRDRLRKPVRPDGPEEQCLHLALGRPLVRRPSREELPEHRTTRPARATEPPHGRDPAPLRSRARVATRSRARARPVRAGRHRRDRTACEPASWPRFRDTTVRSSGSSALVSCTISPSWLSPSPARTGDLDQVPSATGQPMQRGGGPMRRDRSEPARPTRGQQVALPGRRRAAHPVDVVVELCQRRSATRSTICSWESPAIRACCTAEDAVMSAACRHVARRCPIGFHVDVHGRSPAATWDTHAFWRRLRAHAVTRRRQNAGRGSGG